MAEVYLASAGGAEGFSKDVVLKVIRSHLARDPQFVRLFIAEAQLASRLTHPNIVQVFDFGKHDDTYYLAMEFVQGASLSDLRLRCREVGTPFPLVLAAEVGAQVARGLHFAHTLGQGGVVHRDVSPQNILLSLGGEVKLTDFGIAKASTSNTAPGVLKGKYAYMSPEQARGESIDARSDIFALGIVLWELMTGGRLFVGDTDLAVLRAVGTSAIAPPARLNPDVPDRLSEIVMKALSRNIRERFQTASELDKALSNFLLEFADLLEPTPVDFVRRLVSDASVEGRRATADRHELLRSHESEATPLHRGLPAAPQERLRSLAIVVVASVLIAGVSLILAFSFESASPERQVQPQPLRATLHTPPLPQPRPQPVVAPQADVSPRVHFGPGTVTVTSKQHGRIIGDRVGVGVPVKAGKTRLSIDYVSTERRPRFGLPEPLEIATFASFFDDTGRLIESRTIRRSPVVPPVRAARAQLWIVTDRLLDMADYVRDFQVFTGTDFIKAIRQQIQIELAPEERFRFEDLYIPEVYSLEVRGDADVLAVLSPATRATFEGQEGRFPANQVLLHGNRTIRFSDANELWLSIVSSSDATPTESRVSIKALTQALTPDAAMARQAQLALEMKLGDREAKSRANDCIKKFPDSMACYLALADISASLGENREAQEAYTRFLDLSPINNRDRGRVVEWLFRRPNHPR